MIVAFESAQAAAAFADRHDLGRHVISPLVFDTGRPAAQATPSPLAGDGPVAGHRPADLAPAAGHGPARHGLAERGPAGHGLVGHGVAERGLGGPESGGHESFDRLGPVGGSAQPAPSVADRPDRDAGRAATALADPSRVGECPAASGVAGLANPDRRGRTVDARPPGLPDSADGDAVRPDVAAGERARLVAEYRRAIIALLALEPVPLTGLHGGGVTPGEARAYELGQLRHAQAVLAELARAWSPSPDRDQPIAR
ncbi:hypothetical protein I6A60_26375 [Frankia sp. AgB1.9]|uniref:hypothetical protein n=1 Tax=unclassified Frankia TaxID=2632575 RepID=UPI00193182F4|nr:MULTISPECIES: hypothetical protein [unclassified Frankia]MBL7494404.1 hypothetical protein [Frankia sp. AgW1.1]MBL7551365.1 hypothetical protein [Frankia sp. AgB1.9]MBL7624150.1 hypothetical protein [Frankia sp. AgB1.8]